MLREHDSFRSFLLEFGRAVQARRGPRPALHVYLGAVVISALLSPGPGWGQALQGSTDPSYTPLGASTTYGPADPPSQAWGDSSPISSPSAGNVWPGEDFNSPGLDANGLPAEIPAGYWGPGVQGGMAPEIAPWAGAIPDPPLDPRTLEWLTSQGGPDRRSLESPFFYRADEAGWRFLAMGAAGFGDASFESLPYLDPDRPSGIATGMALRFLEGPITPDLHPRLYDFRIAYQHRAMLLNGWSFDVAATVGMFTDFEGSSRDGLRFPGHAVLAGPLGNSARWILGVDYLDRDDFAWLPVVGIRWEPRSDWQLQLEFPRPEIRWLATPNRSFYVRGELAGGTWDIEQVNSIDDVMTVREIDVMFGTERLGNKQLEAFEIGYAMARRLEFRSGTPDVDLPDAWIFRFVSRF